MAQRPGTAPLSVSIGQVPLTLFFQEDSLFEKAGRRYAGFSTPHSSGFPIFLSPEAGPLHATSSADYSLHGATLHVDSAAAHIRGVHSEFTVDSLLRVLLSMILLLRRGFLLHAATVERAGRAYIFMGCSGAGKSTVASLSPSGAPLSDEISLLRAGDSGWLAHGTPFWGEFRSGNRNAHLPVAGIYALVQAAENRVEEISPREALRALLPNVLFFSGSAEQRNALLCITAECAEALPFFRLQFRRDASFWEVLP